MLKFTTVVSGVLLSASSWAADGSAIALTPEDIEAHRSSMFTSADTDGDGLISPEEFTAHHPARPPTGRRHGHSSASGGGRERHGGRYATPVSSFMELDDEIFSQLDKDGDGTLSRAEFSSDALAAARRELFKATLFERLDADGDGYLTPSEFPPSQANVRHGKHGVRTTHDQFRQGAH